MEFLRLRLCQGPGEGTQSSHRYVVDPHAAQRPPVVTEVILDGRIGHL